MRHHMPRLGEYWPSYWNSKIDLRRQLECFSVVHVSTMPFIFRFFCGRATITSRLVLGPMQQMRSRWKALDMLESLGQAASAAAMIMVMRLTGS